MKRILVIDGLGGGLGSEIITRLKGIPDIEIIAVGTNSFATGSMLRAGANRGATGENAIKVSSLDADIIIGPWGIVIPNSMMGEITTGIAEAVATSKAIKVLIPVSHPRFLLVEETTSSLNKLINLAMEKILEILDGRVDSTEEGF
ncbi:MAG: DUF3842 family protein [bacterium]|nr:DUF3842 family protein [bacterium]